MSRLAKLFVLVQVLANGACSGIDLGEVEIDCFIGCVEGFGGGGFTIGGPSLESVWGSSATDVFAVGDIGTILHYDGDTWSGQASGSTNWLYGVWGSSATDVFAVGVDGTILHYDGDTWSVQASGTGVGLLGVWGSSATDVFAVGGNRAIGEGTILHYDGDTWREHSQTGSS